MTPEIKREIFWSDLVADWMGRMRAMDTQPPGDFRTKGMAGDAWRKRSAGGGR